MKNKIDLIVIKQEIDTLNPDFRMKKKVYEIREFTDKYPFLDINNKEYFEKTSVSVLAPRTKVFYLGEVFYIDKINSFKKYCGDLVFGDSVVTEYTIVKSLTDKKSKHFDVFESDFKVLETYWFLSSSGKICSSSYGLNKQADKWRECTGNFFSSYEECRVKFDELCRKYKLGYFETKVLK